MAADKMRQWFAISPAARIRTMNWFKQGSAVSTEAKVMSQEGDYTCFIADDVSKHIFSKLHVKLFWLL